MFIVLKITTVLSCFKKHCELISPLSLAIYSVILGSLTACSGDDITPLHSTNPASNYCLDNDGTLETIKHINGDILLCTLPDGEVIETWELFRRDHQKT
ncbi:MULTISPECIES: putative hemolysin [Shewanella]|uniref:DUF333 domain-containing protein n=1 Tax=Shewanella japonica TaxID=93973 RepID=A0ABM6JPZ0_9GAMM|nr:MULTISPECIES: DUF333 domain-containing protein [Shewanella]ARD24273.1 hypothetical protein SJ2017_4045 [Shewanella japonica]KPZ71369.1 hypothetical protein AN944_01744 [Shewanella sp. P1-14-1]